MKNALYVAPLAVVLCGGLALTVAALVAQIRPRGFAKFVAAVAVRSNALCREVADTYRNWQRFRAFNRALAEFRRSAPVLRVKPSDNEVGAPRD